MLDFAENFCNNAQAIFEKNLEIADANVRTWDEMRVEIDQHCKADDWDAAVALIERVLQDQPEDAKVLVDEKDFYVVPIRTA